MTVTSRPRAPLARTTLINVGARIAIIITLTTFFSYLHMRHTLRAAALTQLEQYVSERGQREQTIFVLAEDNHAVLKKALAERIRALGPEDVSTRFERLFVALPDGTVRNRAEGFDGTRMPGLFVPRGVRLDTDVRRRILASYDVLAQYGPALHTRFTDTYVTLPEGPLILYWPARPTWCLEAAPDFSVVDLPLFPISRPENNPERKTVWSEVFVDTVAHSSMASASTPLDLEGRHVATLSHDVLLEEMVTRASGDRLPGAYNVIFRDDGQLIAHPELQGATAISNILDTAKQPEGASGVPGSAAQWAHLRDIFERVRARPPGQGVQELPEYHEYLSVQRLQGPGWNFVTVLSQDVVSQPASEAARTILLLGVASLVLELLIMAWVLKRQI
ncbi:MAG TPA: histidine kinase, partial [Archangium sp.]|nr:histidine kinase [Archangium sp.]